MKVTGSIVTYNSAKDIEKCISSILEHTKDINFTLYVSDNNSSDDTVKIVKEKFPEVVLLENKTNGGFGHGHNKVFSLIDSDYHVCINPDIVFSMNTIKVLCEYMETRPKAALITPKILNEDGTEQFLPKRSPRFSYVILSKLPGLKKFRREYTRQDDVFDEPTAIDFCTGCFFVARTSVLKQFKGFCNDYYMYFEDSDLSRRVLVSDMEIIFYPMATVYHDWHRANTKSLRGITYFLKSMMTYFKKWGFS